MKKTCLVLPGILLHVFPAANYLFFRLALQTKEQNDAFVFYARIILAILIPVFFGMLLTWFVTAVKNTEVFPSWIFIVVAIMLSAVFIALWVSGMWIMWLNIGNSFLYALMLPSMWLVLFLDQRQKNKKMGLFPEREVRQKGSCSVLTDGKDCPRCL